MFVYHLDNLIKQKEIKDNRKLTDIQLSEDLSISRPTLSRIKNHHLNNYITSTDVLEKILKYFECENINELIEYKKES